tara:strand:+ start:1627 stop:2004 length:378 start_codon:yes stop_codon:yes gene_type:complete
MANIFTTDILCMAITNRFAYAHFTEDKTSVPCPIVSIATGGDSLKFAIDFRWQERDQPYMDYVIRTLIEFKPDGNFQILKAEGHGDLSDWVEGWWGNDALFTDELASMCIHDFNEAHSDQLLSQD